MASFNTTAYTASSGRDCQASMSATTASGILDTVSLVTDVP